MADHSHPTIERVCDVAVIGGSAAGLAGALQLARQQRRVIVIDDQTPRNAPADHMHGYLGREGASPAELTAVGRDEVRSYGGEVLAGRVLEVTRGEAGWFRLALSGGHTLVARRVLAATGIVDVLPDIPGLADHWGHQVIHCPFCHGFEVRDQRLVQIVTHPMGLHVTPLMRHLTDRLTVVLHDQTGVDEDELARLERGGVEMVHDQVTRVSEAGGTLAVELAAGATLDADAILVGGGFRPRAEVFGGLGLRTSPHPSGLGEHLEVDAMGATGVEGVYAAGNLTDPTLQVIGAAAHGGRVGASIAFSLAREDLEADVRVSGAQADWDLRYAGEAPVWSANPNGTLVDQVTGLTPGRALDVGAGEGADAIWLAEQGWTATANDISAAALARVRAEATRRGLEVELLHSDANDAEAFGPQVFDLVSLQYGSFLRTPDQRGLRNLLGAVAPGGTLLVVHHDMSWLQDDVDAAEQTRVYDPAAFVLPEQIHAALEDDAGWEVQAYDVRDRPAGAASTHHVRDVLLRAVRNG